MTSRWALTIARLTLSAGFVFAGLRKASLGVGSVSGRTVALVVAEQIPGGELFVRVLPAIEVAIGLCLLFRVHVYLNSVLALVMLSVFSGVITVVWIVDPAVTSCGCGLSFGGEGSMAGSLAINITLILGSILIISSQSTKRLCTQKREPCDRTMSAE